MKRRLFNAGAAVSLVLCVVLMGLWIRSYRRWHMLLAEPMALQSANGLIRVTWSPDHAFGYEVESVDALGPEEADDGDPFDSPGGWRDLWWFDFDSSMIYANPGGEFHYRTLTFPYAALTLLTLVAPGLWSIRAVRSRRPGCCPACGYDLRGTPSGASGGTCPECGAATPARDPASPRA